MEIDTVPKRLVRPLFYCPHLFMFFLAVCAVIGRSFVIQQIPSSNLFMVVVDNKCDCSTFEPITMDPIEIMYILYWPKTGVNNNINRFFLFLTWTCIFFYLRSSSHNNVFITTCPTMLQGCKWQTFCLTVLLISVHRYRQSLSEKTHATIHSFKLNIGTFYKREFC